MPESVTVSTEFPDKWMRDIAAAIGAKRPQSPRA